MNPKFSTPLICLSNLFSEKQVYAKCEFLAPSGCFKIRGAVHLLDHLSSQGRFPPLVVPSMGNTALGAATGAKEFGFAMVGVVPQKISRAKNERLQGLGVELVKIEGGGSDLLKRAAQIANERDGYFVHPHLDPFWTNGYQGIAEEILNELPRCRSLVFPLGGGGLLMGLTEYLLRHSAPAQLFACEPYNYPKYAPFQHERTQTIADGLILEVPHPQVQQRIEAAGITIDLLNDGEIRAAMKELYAEHALVVEPSSAITTAFVKKHLQKLEEPVCVILTGANIAREDFDHLVGSPCGDAARH
jgi:threonine dehydratase